MSYSNGKCYCQPEASCKLSFVQPNHHMVCKCSGLGPKPHPSPSIRQRLSAPCSGFCTTEGPGGDLSCSSTSCNSITDCQDTYGSYCVSTCPGDPNGTQCQ